MPIDTTTIDKVELLWGDNPDFEKVKEIFIEHKRWSVVFELIFRHRPSGDYYKMLYYAPATECQESDANDRIGSELIQVYPTEVSVTIYKEADHDLSKV